MNQINLAFNIIWLMAYKDLARRTASDKSLRNKVFNIAKNPKYDGYRRGFTSIKLLIKKPQVIWANNEI